MKGDAARKKSLNIEVKEILLKYIDENIFGESRKLPSEEILAKKLGISRITLRSVLTELSQEGVIYRKHGLGTYVNTDIIQLKHSFNPMLEFDKIIRNSGYEPRIDVVEIDTVRARKDDVDKLKISSMDNVIVMKKIVYADGIPAIFCMDVVSQSMINGGISKSDYEKSIFNFIEKNMNHHIMRGVAEISSVLTSDMLEFDSHVNFIMNKPMLLYEYVNYDDENNPMLWGKIFYDTSMIDFNITRRLNNFRV